MVSSCGDVEIEVEKTLVAAAQNGERAMRRHVLDALVEVEIVGELGALFGLVLGDLGREYALAPFPFAQGTDQGRLLGHALDQDMAGAVERGFHIADAFFRIDEFGRFGIGQQGGVLENGVGERLETGLAGDLRLGAALGPIRSVKILELDLGFRAVDRARQLGRHLALVLDAFQHRDAAVFQLAQVAEALFQLAQLRIVEAAGLLFAIARDERHRCAFGQQLHRGRHLPDRQRRVPPRCAD